ncbi:MAG: TetR/AcrR family transcriptional regulator [Verrucomicrobiota bacterium]
MKKDRQSQILEAAGKLILHHGYQKVTFADIAKELGVSRPTVYQAFPNKEEIYKALVHKYQTEALERVDAVVGEDLPVEKKLLKVIGIWIIEPYQLIHESPMSEDVQNSALGFASETVDQGYAEFERRIVKILKEGKVQGPLPLKRLAHLCTVALRGMKGEANDLAELRSLVSGLVTLVLANQQ